MVWGKGLQQKIGLKGEGMSAWNKKKQWGERYIVRNLNMIIEKMSKKIRLEGGGVDIWNNI